MTKQEFSIKPRLLFRLAVRSCFARRTAEGRQLRAITGSENLNVFEVDLSQVRVRDETVRASPVGGQGYVWLLPRSQVEGEHLSCLFVIDILFGNRAITQRNLDYFLDHQQMFEVIKFNLI